MIKFQDPMKRWFDFIVSFFGLIIFVPLIIPIAFIIWLQDRNSPLYIAPRIGLNGRVFKMVKLRSMVLNAEKSGVDSTSVDDSRITKIGHFIRRFKLDEISQLYNVFIGDMSLVGPRPNVKREVLSYTDEEKILLSVRPGVTDIASIVFSDESEILRGKIDPDLSYNQLIRPYKSRLGLFYIEKRSLWLDVVLCALTITAVVSRKFTLKILGKIMSRLGASPSLIKVAARKDPLQPAAPPGGNSVINSRD